MDKHKNNSSEANSLYYIEVPPHLIREINGFSIDPSIPLPVEPRIPGETLPVEDISWEMIVSGMLKSLLLRQDKKHTRYYRDFILAVKPDIFQELTTSAIYKARNGDYSLAAEIFEILEALDPDNPRTLINTALLLEERASQPEGQSSTEISEILQEKARTYYLRAIECEPVLPDALLNAGFFFRSYGDYSRASVLLKQYLTISTEDEKMAQARTALADMEKTRETDELYQSAKEAMEREDTGEAIRLIRDFLVLDQKNLKAHFLLGWALRVQKEYSEAEKHFLFCLKTENSASLEIMADAYNELAICAMEREDFSGAEEILKEALKKQPDNIKIISNLGTICLKTGRHDEARLYFETVLALEPEDGLAQSLLEMLG